MPENLGTHVLRTTLKEFRQIKTLGDKAMAQLDEREFFTAIDPESNSIAVIVKHLAGNMRSRWSDFLASDGEKPDRHRDDEFIVGPRTTRADVTRWWEEGWRVTLRGDGEAVFRDPRGRVLPNAPAASARDDAYGRAAVRAVEGAVAAVAPEAWEAPAGEGLDVGYVLQVVRGG